MNVPDSSDNENLNFQIPKQRAVTQLNMQQLVTQSTKVQLNHCPSCENEEKIAAADIFV